jgi:ectoine hydroxylase-related dioxygenase (phytanoyl-CoA dioxygenase family)
MSKKFLFNSSELEDQYIKNGYLVINKIFEKSYINKLSNLILAKVDKLKKNYSDYHDVCNKVMDDFEKSTDYDELIFHDKLKKLMIRFLGSDLCVLNFTALWVNAPTNKNPVLKKNEHVDSWTGTGINTIFLKIYLTDCDDYNGMTVFPGTHLHGLYPVKNRTLHLSDDIQLPKGINLKECKKGDVLIWHPLLVHSTTGHSPKKRRVSMTLRYTSTETEFTSQERALGYKTLSVSCGNVIRRYIGNDNLQPFRVYGGQVAIDKRLSKLYNQSYYKKTIK